jgi:hypothetical protein
MGWLVAGAVLLPLAFGAWILGHFLRARTQAIRHVLSKGVLAPQDRLSLSRARSRRTHYRVGPRRCGTPDHGRADGCHSLPAATSGNIRAGGRGGLMRAARQDARSCGIIAA